MGSKDIISKSVLGHLAADIANLLLNLGVDANSVELLDTEQQRVELLVIPCWICTRSIAVYC